MSKEPIRFSVTGPAGNIDYALPFRIASSAMFWPRSTGGTQPVDTPALNALEGVGMELDDCAFPLLKDLVATTDLEEDFKDIN